MIRCCLHVTSPFIGVAGFARAGPVLIPLLHSTTMNFFLFFFFCLLQGNVNDGSPLENMRDIEQYLEIMKRSGDAPDHVKGNVVCSKPMDGK